MIVDVVIPALNEEEAIGKVLRDIPKDQVRTVFVADNGSTDNTAQVAQGKGARVVSEPQKGYGAACLAALHAVGQQNPVPDIVVFLDGDYSDHPEQMPQLIQPIANQEYDMVIGSRALGNRESGAMLPQQLFGNWLATWLIRMIYGFRYTDLGPFRAISWSALQQIGMVDQDFGWTVEMQVKALKKKLRICEVPVDYRKRKGQSKVTGTIKGSVMAGYKIIYTIFKYAS